MLTRYYISFLSIVMYAAVNTTDLGPNGLLMGNIREIQERLAQEVLSFKAMTGFGAFDEGMNIPVVRAFSIVHYILVQVVGTSLLLAVAVVIHSIVNYQPVWFGMSSPIYLSNYWWHFKILLHATIRDQY